MKLIDDEVLNNIGGTKLTLDKKEIIFNEGDSALYYYQVDSGKIKMYSILESGAEYIHGVFCCGESFGEAALFGDFPFPASAMSIEASTVWKLKKELFLNLLKSDFNLHLNFDKALSKKMNYKSMLLKDIMSSNTEKRILSLINYFKEVSISKKETLTKYNNQFYYVFPFSRNELANMIGLRLETVIRYVKILEQKGKISIINRKIYCKIDVIG